MLHSADCENGLVKMSRYLQERLVQLGKAATKMTGGILAVVMRRNQPSPIYDFVALRAAVILGCYGWLFFLPLAPADRRAVALLLHAFSAYSLLLYFLIARWQGRVLRFSSLVLAIDLAFAFALIRVTGGVESPFTPALYLIAAIQAFYYGIRRGIGVLLSLCILYVIIIWPTWQPTSAGVVSLRLGFMALVVVSLGILSEREWRRRRELEAVNREMREKSARLEEAYAQQRDLQEHLENIMSSITNGIIAVDRQGRVSAWNRVVEGRYGITSAEAIGRRLVDVLPVLQQEGVTEALRGLLLGESNAMHLRELEHYTQKEGKTTVNIDGYPLRDGNGTLRGAVLVIEDVTSRVALERQVRQAEKLAALGTLSAGLAHEINNPLGIITSRAEVALMEAAGKDIPKQLLDDLKVIEKHAHRAARIAQGLLSFSRQTAWRLVPVDANQVVEETLLLIEKQLLREQIALERCLASDLPKVMGSPNHLQQVLLNLITNARDAMTVGDRLRVESRMSRDGARVQIVIADTGKGIPAELAERIFDPFFTTKAGGTGLGLSISYGIIKEHGGTLEVESEVGKGATFTIGLPVADR
jgi:PAS domain S-box-containing protein